MHLSCVFTVYDGHFAVYCSFPKEEENILELWEKLDAFKEQLRRTEGKPEYIFYGAMVQHAFVPSACMTLVC